MYLEEQYLTITDYYSQAGPNVLTFYQLKRFYVVLFMKESVSSLIMCSFVHLPCQNLSLLILDATVSGPMLSDSCESLGQSVVKSSVGREGEPLPIKCIHLVKEK